LNLDLTLIQLLMHKHAKHAKHVSHLCSVKTRQCLVAVQKYLFAIWGLCWHIFPESAREGFLVKKQPLYYIFTPSHLLIYIFTLSHLLIYIFTPLHLLI
jgi:hypothetical protein